MRRKHFLLFAFIISIHVNSIEAQPDKIAWLTNTSQKMRQSNLDGSTVEDLINTGLSSPTWLAVDEVNYKIYFVDGSMIKRCDLDGSNIENFLTSLDSPEGIAIDANNSKLYFISAQKVQSINFDGSNLDPDIVTSLSYPEGLAIDLTNQQLYVTDRSDDKIVKSNYTGSIQSDFMNSINSLGISIDASMNLTMELSPGVLCARLTFWNESEAIKPAVKNR